MLNIIIINNGFLNIFIHLKIIIIITFNYNNNNILNYFLFILLINKYIIQITKNSYHTEFKIIII